MTMDIDKLHEELAALTECVGRIEELIGEPPPPLYVQQHDIERIWSDYRSGSKTREQSLENLDFVELVHTMKDGPGYITSLINNIRAKLNA